MTTFDKVYCPVCGYSHSANKWAETVNFTPLESVGARFESRGRASIQKIGSIPTYGLIPAVFEDIKYRILFVLSRWERKGLLGIDELNSYLSGLRVVQRRKQAEDRLIEDIGLGIIGNYGSKHEVKDGEVEL